MQAVFSTQHAVVFPECFVQHVQLRHQGQSDVQVHLQVLQPLLQLSESRAVGKENRNIIFLLTGSKKM